MPRIELKIYIKTGNGSMKHIEISCNSLAECYARLRDCELIYVSDLGKKSKVVIDIDTDSPFDGSFIHIPECEEERK